MSLTATPSADTDEETFAEFVARKRVLNAARKAAAPVRVGDRFRWSDGRVFAVLEDNAFGRVTLKQADRAYFGDATKNEIRRNLAEGRWTRVE